MSANSFTDLIRHRHHKIAIVTYGSKDEPINVAIECEDCNEVLMDFNRYNEDPEDPMEDSALKVGSPGDDL